MSDNRVNDRIDEDLLVLLCLGTLECYPTGRCPP